MVKIKLNTGRAQIEIDAENPKEAVKQLAAFQEILSDPGCGSCQSTAIRFEHRQDKEGHDYYSLRCLECGCELSFGQHKSGNTLFAKRQDNPETRGWKKWQREQTASAGNSRSSEEWQ